MTKNKKVQLKFFYYLSFYKKITIYLFLITDVQARGEASKFINFSIFLRVIFALLDLDPILKRIRIHILDPT
jgi:hypothetical protein